MGLFDSIKNVFGGKPEADVTVSPSQMLRDAGIDPSGLKMSFGSDGTVTVSGHIAAESDRQKIVDTLTSAPGITRVEDRMSLAPAEPVETTPEAAPPAPPQATPEAAADEDTQPAVMAEGGRTYTVKSGDTLWKISEEIYGNGSKYMKIFEANTDLLEHPDRIFPGQELKIPDLED
jgi:nucleoid-associated protein YgaU